MWRRRRNNHVRTAPKTTNSMMFKKHLLIVSLKWQSNIIQQITYKYRWEEKNIQSSIILIPCQRFMLMKSVSQLLYFQCQSFNCYSLFISFLFSFVNIIIITIIVIIIRVIIIMIMNVNSIRYYHPSPLLYLFYLYLNAQIIEYL
jgi:hypothetical protein